MGRWVWLLLLNRPLLSLLSEVYAFTSNRRVPLHQVRRLPEGVRRELRYCVALVPFLTAEVSPPHFSRLICTDASQWGQGICIAVPPRRRSPHLLLPDLVLLRRAHWVAIVSSPWRYPGSEHVNVLELRAIITAVRLVASSPHAAGSLLTVYCDSQVVVGAIRTGRSSSPRLNRLLRALAALLLSTDVRLLVVWVPTDQNPADTPSRASSQ